MKNRNILLLLSIIIALTHQKPFVAEIHQMIDFSLRMKKYSKRDLHSIWVVFEAKWCPQSKNAIVGIKKSLDKIKKPTVLFRVDW